MDFDAYYNGLTAGFTGHPMRPPPWLSELGWDATGVWAVVKHADLLKAVPGSSIFSATSETAHISLMNQPPNDAQLMQYYEKLEKAQVPLLASCSSLFVVSKLCRVIRSYTGRTQLVGTFFLEGSYDGKQTDLRLALPGSLVITEPPGGMDVVDPKGVIKDFRVRASLTADFLVAHTTSTPLFVIEATEEPDFPMEEVSASRRSSSRLTRTFLSRFNS